MFMGLTIANIGGVPAATGWRNHRLADVLHLLLQGLGLLAMVSLWFSCRRAARERPDVKELSVLLRPQVLRVADHRAGRRGDVYAIYLHFASAQYADHASSLFITAMLVLIGVGFR